mmetsp:Transcript_26720/g.77004  ORF Transcript_26720/g.77004 Transcript_26720/m.77004 type:complete len:111 (+) Transcript_26720:68-400(+)
MASSVAFGSLVAVMRRKGCTEAARCLAVAPAKSAATSAAASAVAGATSEPLADAPWAGVLWPSSRPAAAGAPGSVATPMAEESPRMDAFLERHYQIMARTETPSGAGLSK